MRIMVGRQLNDKTSVKYCQDGCYMLGVQLACRLLDTSSIVAGTLSSVFALIQLGRT